MIDKIFFSLLISLFFCALVSERSSAQGSSSSATENSKQDEGIRGCIIRKSENAELANEKSCLNLSSGEILVFAEKQTELCANQYKLLLKKGTIALISHEKQEVVKVRNMFEEKRASTKVCIKQKVLNLSSGEEIVIAPNESALHAAMSKDMLIRRNSNLYNLSSGGILVHSEFLPASLIKQNTILNKLAHCPNKQDKVLYGKILKMAACLGHATSGHGNYSVLTE